MHIVEFSLGKNSELLQLQLQGLGEAMEYMMVKIMILATMPLFSLAVDNALVRQVASKYNVSCILVFGDSSVDSGNNNGLHTTMKSNFPPYGKDFFDSRPTGRFSNGRLATDFVGKNIQPFFLFFSPSCFMLKD